MKERAGVVVRNSKCGWGGVSEGRAAKESEIMWGQIGQCKDFGFYSD